MKKIFILAFALIVLCFSAMPVCAATADSATPDEATPDYDLNIKDGSMTWAYVLIAVASVVVTVILGIIVAKIFK